MVQGDHDTPEKMAKFIGLIEEINVWLEETYWPKEGGERNLDGEWLVGQEKGWTSTRGNCGMVEEPLSDLGRVLITL